MLESNWQVLAIAVANAIGYMFLFLSTRTTAREASAARTAAESAQRQGILNNELAQATRNDVRTIEIATNSMKDELVKVTEVAGVLKGRAEVTAEVAAAAKLNPPAAT